MKYPRGRLLVPSDPEVVGIDPKYIPALLESCIFSLRTAGEFAGKGYCLPSNFDWQVVCDDRGVLVLLQLLRGERL